MAIIARKKSRFATSLMRIGAAVLLFGGVASAQAPVIPDSIPDSTFWNMVTTMSESDGYFRSDNFASNEWTFQHVIPELNRITSPGGIYMGVGPDQNFTYITALKPKMVFIVDIRRQNMLLHLMYKSAFELSANRTEFASLLFARPKPDSVPSTATADQVISAVFAKPTQNKIYLDNFATIRDHLTKTHGFKLTESDIGVLQFVYANFVNIGPGITYQGSTGTPTWWDLQVETDGRGVYRSYMSSEANWQVLKDLHRKNLFVPLIGDFGGPKAIRAVADYLKARNAKVTAFYLSNVEQYLFQYDTWRAFYTNAGTLPIDSSSTFIRSVFNNQGGFRSGNGRTANLLASMADQLKAFTEGRLRSYEQVISTSREP